MTPSAKLTLTVTGCSRCGQEHRVTFVPFSDPVEVDDVTFTHWGTCSTTGDPILMRRLTLPDLA